MGNVHPTIPVELARRLVDAAGLTGAVETGTFHAYGARTLRDLVPQVWSIELSEAFHRQAVDRHGQIDGLTFLLGESAQVLRELSNRPFDGPLLFWLDAHGGTDLFDIPDTTCQCPLLGEIEAIRRFPRAINSCILVDDARFLMGPVAGPFIRHRTQDWPTLVDVIDALRIDAERYITVLDDVIICVPPALRATVDNWWLEMSTQRQGDEAFEYLFHQAASPTPALAAKRMVKSLVPAGFMARWYQMRSRASALETDQPSTAHGSGS